MEVQTNTKGDIMDDKNEINWKIVFLGMGGYVIAAILLGFTVYCAVNQ